MKNIASNRLAYIELHAAVFLFGIAGLFAKLVSASPSMIVFGRSAFAAIAIFIAIKIYANKLHACSAKSLCIMTLSGLVLAVHWLLFFHAIQISTVAIGLVGFATFPVFVTFFEPLISKQKLQITDLVTAGIVMFGLVLVAPSFDLSNTGTLGLFWAVVSGALFAVLTLMNRRLVERQSFMTIGLFQNSVAACILLPFVYYAGEIPNVNTVFLLCLLGIFCTALPQTLFIKSLKIIRAQVASVVTTLEPIYGILFAAILLHEIPSMTTIVGAAMVLGAVIIVMRANSI